MRLLFFMGFPQWDSVHAEGSISKSSTPLNVCWSIICCSYRKCGFTCGFLTVSSAQLMNLCLMEDIIFKYTLIKVSIQKDK